MSKPSDEFNRGWFWGVVFCNVLYPPLEHRLTTIPRGVRIVASSPSPMNDGDFESGLIVGAFIGAVVASLLHVAISQVIP